MRFLVAADTGGTFTDVAVYDARAGEVAWGKTLTRYDDLALGVLDGLKDTGVRLPETLLFKHGTTHVINTFIQRSGARTALVATKGFRDTLEIGRGNRPVPFSLEYRRLPPLVPREMRFEVAGRIGARGEEIEALDTAGLRALADHLRSLEVEAVAVSFVNAYANPAHEEAAVALLSGALPGVYVTSGTRLTREWFEFERTSTAAANAYVGARMQGYLTAFEARLAGRGFAGRFYMMGSNGGVLSVERARAQPVALVESGPIGGCIGAAAYARALGEARLIAFDMGGTTAKCALVQDGHFDVQPIYYVGGYDHGFPLKTPVLDIVEVGAGGGSIASVDARGRLSVGPRSAGSEPGPVAFGRGGTEPTVTDANLALGRIDGGAFMQGRLKLDRAAAEAAIRERVARPLGYEGTDAIEVAAQGILDLACVTMAGAIREISIERGHDVREFKLFAFGGGGPLFATALAKSLGIPEVIVPPQPGNFSTVGMLIAGARVDLSRTLVCEANEAAVPRVAAAYAELEAEAQSTMHSELGAEALAFERMLEMRYRGQKHTVAVAWEPGQTAAALVAAFEAVYRRRYGNTNADCAVEILGARLGAQADVPAPRLEKLAGLAPSGGSAPAPRLRRVHFPAPHGWQDVPVVSRAALAAGHAIEGPAVVEEYSATTILMPGDRATVGALGELAIRCAP